ncbi:MAG: tRNA (adenosine(37)-N6)-threonylcarbamoyltransferase complex ATPase subunit type 1 TsaE [Nitrospirae bacterium]|nr:tRNA (adenosine(37)-N6)-threonylcarbamoyltransferase complex ATPase subunit type 1 TsaE [Nitrospirota bacterium]
MRFLSRGPEETFRYGALLGRHLRIGDTVCLFGELGSGKTTFVKGIASAFNIPDREVASASFTMIAEYRGTRDDAEVPFNHIDLYRVKDARDLDSIGLEEYIGRGGISVIEWAERIGKVDECIEVTFISVDDETREITIRGIDEADWDNL